MRRILRHDPSRDEVDSLRVGSLFSGCGLGDYGLELAGMDVVFQVEIDPYCQKVLNLRWPDVPKWTDISMVNTDELPAVDCLAGGFPCQDLSVAGKQEGITGKRSGLWSEYVRIIRALRPRYIIVENVPGLLIQGMGTVLGDLAACGYDAEWQSISAAAVGAPHLRDRVWIIAYPNAGNGIREEDTICTRRVAINGGIQTVAHAEGSRERPEEYIRQSYGSERGGKAVANTTSENDGAGSPESLQGQVQQLGVCGEQRDFPNADRPPQGHGHNGACSIFPNASQGDERLWRSLSNPNHWLVEPNVGRVAHGVPVRVDRLKALGNGQVVQVAEYVGRQVMRMAQ